MSRVGPRSANASARYCWTTRHRRWSPHAEALLYAADRAQHVAEVIRPSLESGKIVVSDRFIDSSLAYQGIARGLGLDEIYQISSWATGGLIPNLVIYLQVDPQVAMHRVDRDRDRIESEDRDFHERVAAAYIQLAKKFPERFVVVDAARTPAEVHQEVVTTFTDRACGSGRIGHRHRPGCGPGPPDALDDRNRVMNVWTSLEASRSAAGLARQVAAGEIAHAWLLLGPAGSGKHTTAVAIAASLNCSVEPGVGCGECSSCARIQRGRHPDVHHVIPEGPIIPVDIIREIIIPEASRSPFEGRFKVFIIEEADRMNESAQNALLKTLEEPQPDTVFVLVSDNEEEVLDTIRSRCRIVRLEPVSEGRIVQLLVEAGVPDDRALLAALVRRGFRARSRPGNGSPGRGTQEVLDLAT